MKKITATILTGVLIMLTSCNGGSLDHYKDGQPTLDIKEYFNGSIKAWGVVQDWRGRVVRKFDIDMVGSWNGDEGKLEEHFSYYDGETQQRVWKITKTGENSYEGTASDIVDKATGKQAGDAVNWHYVMDVPVDDTTYRLKLDDWMWQMNDGVLINRSYMKKFGITVAELTIFMQKQEQAK